MRKRLYVFLKTEKFKGKASVYDDKPTESYILYD